MRSGLPTQSLFTPDRLLPSLRADSAGGVGGGAERKMCDETRGLLCRDKDQ